MGTAGPTKPLPHDGIELGPSVIHAKIATATPAATKARHVAVRIAGSLHFGQCWTLLGLVLDDWNRLLGDFILEILRSGSAIFFAMLATHCGFFFLAN
jgi:hypothetical protein